MAEIIWTATGEREKTIIWKFGLGTLRVFPTQGTALWAGPLENKEENAHKSTDPPHEQPQLQVKNHIRKDCTTRTAQLCAVLFHTKNPL